MSNIESKVVFITGASSGLGEAAARLLSAQGASIDGGECPRWVKNGHRALQSRCPLYPQERTWPSATVMSAKCQKADI
jgi:NAD(P)-dependent dehydrogenase (short-subunit alcohol dehydrogenase family)